MAEKKNLEIRGKRKEEGGRKAQLNRANKFVGRMNMCPK
jgi:hypothetical protein